MSTSGAAPAAPRHAGPLSLVLTPIRGQLIVACMLAAAGAMLTLAPLAAIAHIARIVLASAGSAADAWPEIWWVHRAIVSHRHGGPDSPTLAAVTAPAGVRPTPTPR